MPPLRADLMVIKQFYEDRTYYVVKDPISLQYFRLTAEDYFLATLFDGKRTLRQVRDAYVERFPHLRLDFSEEEIDERVSRFANDLGLLQFLSVQGARLKPRYEAMKEAKKQSKGGFYKLVNNVFFARFSVFDPDQAVRADGEAALVDMDEAIALDIDCHGGRRRFHRISKVRRHGRHDVAVFFTQ